MVDVPPSTPSPPPEDMHWGISYLREDIQNLRNAVHALHGRVDMFGEALTRHIDSRFALLTATIALNGLVMGTTFAAFQIMPAQ